MNLESGVVQVHIEDIIPNRFQPRLAFDEEGLKELSDSIKEHGIIQPLVLRKLGNKYEIIAGERRYKASTMAGLTTVPAVIANVDDNKAAEVAIVENVQRRDLTAIEEARSYKNLLDKGYLTQEQLAKRMGLSQPAIANKLRLLNLDEEVQQALLDEKISERHARTLLTLQDKEAQKEWLHRIINERLTVRQLDLELKKLKEQQAIISEESDESGDVPLVENNRNIEDIKAQATDIRDINKKMTPEEIMRPTEVINEELETLDLNPVADNQEDLNLIDDFQEVSTTTFENENPFTVATSVPESNIITPESTSTFVEPDKIIENNEESKFFNFNNISTPEENPAFTEVSTQTEISSPKMEIFDIPNQSSAFIDVNNEKDIIEDRPVIESIDNTFNNQNQLNTAFDTNPNNKFFTPVYDANQNYDIVQPKQEEKIVNPMVAVEKLTPGYEEKQKEVEGNGLKNAIGSIRSCIENLGTKGFLINVEEIDFNDTYQINIQIKKDN